MKKMIDKTPRHKIADILRDADDDYASTGEGSSANELADA